MWENVFNNNDDDTNTLYNNFLNTFLRLFYTSFPKTRANIKHNPKDWLTNGIKTSCSTKRRLYLLCRESNDAKIKAHYKKYCKIPSSVITLAKKMNYDNKLANSNNKPKTTWSIIKSINNNKTNFKNIPMIQIDGKTTTYYQTIVEKFNNYYISVADNITNGNFPKNTIDDLIKINPLNYLYSAF
jgi:hypothetical protein